VVTEEFLAKYNKSVKEGYDDFSLIDYSTVKPDRNNYKNFTDYWEKLCDYLIENIGTHTAVKKKRKPSKEILMAPRKLTNRQKTTLKKHSKHHTKKHMSSMKKAMKKGKTFKAAHKKAMKKVGR